MSAEISADLELIYAPIEREMLRLEQFLRAEYAAEEPLIHDILVHIARFRGKQLRPALLFLSSKLIGSRITSSTIKIGAVLELIHTATLVHDDLLDSAEMRRRVETVHRRWGDRPAILMGDFIYSRAFELSTEVEGMAGLLARTTNAICEGELLQIGSRYRPETDEELYFEIIRKKTAILHAVACDIAGRMAGLPAERCELLRSIGLDLGMAFQVIDDCLDYAGVEEVVGKSLGTDLRQGKLTLPLLCLREELSSVEREWLDDVLRAPVCGDDEIRIHEWMRSYGALEKAFVRAEAFVEDAKRKLDSFQIPGNRESLAARESFELAADYILRRQK